MQYVGNKRSDVETGLYYCKSRYYNPEWGRFLNADDVSYLDPSSIGGVNLYAYCLNNPISYIDPNGNFPLLAMAIFAGIMIVGGGTVGGITAHQNGTNVWEGIGKGMAVGAMIAGSVVLTVGSFYVTGGLGSNLGLMMFTYGSTTGLSMLEVGVTQYKYSKSKGESGMSHVIDAMFANSGSIYGSKAVTKMFPFAQHFTWHIGGGYKYTIPGEGGAFYGHYTTGEAWGFFKNFLRAKPTKLSYAFATYAFGSSVYRFGKSVFGEPNYDAWILY